MKINIQNSALRITAGFPEQFPRDPIPMIALSGRSNVGKSSLINALLDRKALARVSSAPGKTVTVNFYDIDGKIFLVDLPGYGFAKRSGVEKAQWSALTDGFFTKNDNIDRLCLVIQLIDIRVGATKDDCDMLNWLIASRIPHIIVCTKSDKLSKTNLKSKIAELSALEIFSHAAAVIPFSAVNKTGKKELWAEIIRHADNPANERNLPSQ